MQRQELIREIQASPPIRVSRALARMLYEAPTVNIKHCANPICYNFFTVIRKRKEYCGRYCANVVRIKKVSRMGGTIAGNKRRGSNPSRHISIRVDGKMVYLHRYIVESELGMKLADDEIVHHLDNNKHHNCFWKSVHDCPFPHPYDGPNLEILSGEARREHITYHQEQMQRARKRK